MRWRFTLLVLVLSGMMLPNIMLAAQEDGLQVMATHSILADIARNVAGGRGRQLAYSGRRGCA